MGGYLSQVSQQATGDALAIALLYSTGDLSAIVVATVQSPSPLFHSPPPNLLDLTILIVALFDLFFLPSITVLQLRPLSK